jgi:hypothetical protein
VSGAGYFGENFRYKEKKFWTSMGDILYERYEFSLNRIKGMIKRVSLVFERLVTSQTIPLDDHQPFLNVETWICARVENFEDLSFSYRDKMLYGPIYLRHKIFSKDLFAP